VEGEEGGDDPDMLHGELVQQKVLHDGSLQKVVTLSSGMIIQLQVLRVGKTLIRLSHQLKGMGSFTDS